MVFVVVVWFLTVVAAAGSARWLTRRAVRGQIQHLIDHVAAIRPADAPDASTAPAMEYGLGAVITALNPLIASFQQRQLESDEALSDAEDMNVLKTEVIANVSHELRTPLNAITNIPGFLAQSYHTHKAWHCARCQKDVERDALFAMSGSPACTHCGGTLTERDVVEFRGDAQEHLKFVTMFADASQHMLRVVDDLLNFSKLQAGKARLDMQQISAFEVCERLRPSMDFVASQKNVSIQWPTRETSVDFTADPVKIAQILLNLITNSVKFTEPGGRVRVDVSRADKEPVESLCFRVTDTGAGIPKEQLSLIFERFRQVEGTHRRVDSGTGLGLTISRQLAELHGGRIWAESERGEGSTFYVVIPLAPLRAPVTDRPAQGGPSADRPVIVVEDDTLQLTLCKHMLERLGFKVEVVTDALQAIPRITQLRPQFVVLDVMMPTISGLTILEQLKADVLTRDIPVLVSTSYHGNKQLVRSLGGLWLPKPWSGSDLSRCLLRSQLIDGVTERRAIPMIRYTANKRAQSAASARPRVLYVEDEDINWEVAAACLGSKFDLVRANDAADCFAKLSAGIYDLVLMDIGLANSQLNGVETAMLLKGQYKGEVPGFASGFAPIAAPIIVVSAYDHRYLSDGANAAGIVEFFKKPVDFLQLSRTMSSLLAPGSAAPRTLD